MQKARVWRPIAEQVRSWAAGAERAKMGDCEGNLQLRSHLERGILIMKCASLVGCMPTQEIAK